MKSFWLVENDRILNDFLTNFQKTFPRYALVIRVEKWKKKLFLFLPFKNSQDFHFRKPLAFFELIVGKHEIPNVCRHHKTFSSEVEKQEEKHGFPEIKQSLVSAVLALNLEHRPFLVLTVYSCARITFPKTRRNHNKKAAVEYSNSGCTSGSEKKVFFRPKKRFKSVWVKSGSAPISSQTPRVPFNCQSNRFINRPKGGGYPWRRDGFRRTEREVFT